MGSDFIHPPREPQKWAVRILLECFLVIFIFYCFVFTAAVKLFNFRLRQCGWCFYALPDGAFTASRVPGDAQLHGRASQISARKSTTGNVCLSVHRPTSNDYDIDGPETQRGWGGRGINKHPLCMAAFDGHFFLDIFVQHQKGTWSPWAHGSTTEKGHFIQNLFAFKFEFLASILCDHIQYMKTNPDRPWEFEKSFRNVIH